ncbi:MAG TPA: ATP-binding protein [Pelobium sp.]|nr:ATP-binding protein [Pelobium sp.]
MNKKLIKIAVVGPESSGKSTISQELAIHYQTNWIPEYSRFYCENLKREATLQDELNMFYGQVALEKAVESITTKNLLICDTTFLTVKIWCDELFKETPQTVLDKLKAHPYDFYVLLKNDLPWQDDPLRNFKGRGDYFMDVWRKELKALNACYTEVGGLNNRTTNAIKAIDNFLNSTDFNKN